MSATATGEGSRGRLGLVAGGHAGEHDRAVEPGRRRAGEIGVQPVADHERPARPQTVHGRAQQRTARACRRSGRGRPWRTPERRRSGRYPGAGRRRRETCGRGRRRSSRPRPADAWVAIRSSSKSKPSWPATTTSSASAARGVPLTIRCPESATCRKTAGDPITKVGAPETRSASRNWIAAPTVTTSSSEACRPSAHSLRTYSSGERRESLVTKASDLPAPAARRAPRAPER